jgi:protein SCO1/2
VKQLPKLAAWLACGLTCVEAWQPGSARAATPGQAAAAADKAERSAKEYQPNVPLVTQEGRHVRFYDDLVKGRVVLINMMFTTCASICPPMTANLLRVQKILREKLGARFGQEVLMLSITVDPEVDTPAVLKQYAARYKVGPGWTFLTGKKVDIDGLLAKLGSTDPDKDRHSGMLLIGNDRARAWQKGFAMSEPADVAGVVLKMLSLGEKKP